MLAAKERRRKYLVFLQLEHKFSVELEEMPQRLQKGDPVHLSQTSIYLPEYIGNNRKWKMPASIFYPAIMALFCETVF